MVGRFLVFEDGKVSVSSKKCFSCELFEGKREIVDVEKFCSGVVVRIKCDDESICEKRGRRLPYDSRCSNWKIWRYLERTIRKLLKV